MENSCSHGAGHQPSQSTALILCGAGNKTSQRLEAHSSGELMSKTERRAAFTALLRSSSFQKQRPKPRKEEQLLPLERKGSLQGQALSAISRGLCGHGACPGARTGSRRFLLTH